MMIKFVLISLILFITFLSKLDAKDISSAEVNIEKNKVNQVLSTNVVGLFIRGINVAYERELIDAISVYGNFTIDTKNKTATTFYLDGACRWYPLGNFNKNMTNLAVGPILRLAYAPSLPDFAIGLGAEASCKWVFFEHLTLEPIVMATYPLGFDLKIAVGYYF